MLFLHSSLIASLINIECIQSIVLLTLLGSQMLSAFLIRQLRPGSDPIRQLYYILFGTLRIPHFVQPI